MIQRCSLNAHRQNCTLVFCWGSSGWLLWLGAWQSGNASRFGLLFSQTLRTVCYDVVFLLTVETEAVVLSALFFGVCKASILVYLALEVGLG